MTMRAPDFNEDPKYSRIERNIVISVLSSNKHCYLEDVQRKKRKSRVRKVFSYFFKAHTGSLLLILGAYTTIIFIACTILVLSVFRLENLTDNSLLYLNNKNSSSHGKVNNNTDDDSEVKLSNKLFREFIWPYKDSSKLFNCSVLNQVKKFKYLTSGWTKSVFSFNYNGQNFALKTVNLNGNDLKSCMQTHSLKTCYEKASSKMYKEYILSRELSHSSIVKVLGWCVSNDSMLENVAIVTELCSPLDTISLLQMSFHKRLHIIFHIMELVNYLSSSSLGSVAINDFRSEQFVLCDGTPKLTDLDDLSIEEPRCRKNDQCSLSAISKYLKLPKNYVNDSEVKCVNYVCAGYNEKQNVINVYRHFINLFLTIGMPDSLKDDIESFIDVYTFKWNAKFLFKKVENIYKKFNNTRQNEKMPFFF
ncbi:UNVERIFIED_CONTAM: hypothetical protein PYX00_009486 [Menopon gallinae]|uniref:Protein kinase domain-containing protein n=1 Tax=Menopon gallinae TaxID=328185 RepID=A0AAW2HBP0_9NEOP